MSLTSLIATRKTLIAVAFVIAGIPIAVAIAATIDQPAPRCPEAITGWTRHAAVAKHVILVSIDGLHPQAVDALGSTGAPHLHRLRREGATTDNARTDHAYTVTLPNHVSQLTARAVTAACGHDWTMNGKPPAETTLHTNKGEYVYSVFDVLHDAGMRAVMFASKSKFRLFPRSYNRRNVEGEAGGSGDKIARFVYDADTDLLVSDFLGELTATRPNFGFLHLRDPDSHGHKFGWDLSTGSAYLEAVRRADSLVGRVLHVIDGDPLLRHATAVLVTSDHAGQGRGHGHAKHADVYTIPFYAWGAGIDRGVDLYALNHGTRLDPDRQRPSYRPHLQPIRNGDAANLVLDLLGLPNVPGSTINTHAAPLITSHAEMLHFETAVDESSQDG